MGVAVGRLTWLLVALASLCGARAGDVVTPATTYGSSGLISGRAVVDMPLAEAQARELAVGEAVMALGQALMCRVIVEQVPCRGVTASQLSGPVTVAPGARTVGEFLDLLVAANPLFKWELDPTGAIHVRPRAAELDPEYPLTKPWPGGCSLRAAEPADVVDVVAQRLAGLMPESRWELRRHAVNDVIGCVPVLDFVRERAHCRSVLCGLAAKLGLSLSAMLGPHADGLLFVGYAFWRGDRQAVVVRSAAGWQRPVPPGLAMNTASRITDRLRVKGVAARAVLIALQRRYGLAVAIEEVRTHTRSLDELAEPAWYDAPAGSLLDVLDRVTERDTLAPGGYGPHGQYRFVPRGIAQTRDYPLLKPLPRVDVRGAGARTAVSRLAAALTAATGLTFASQVTDRWVDQDGDPVLLNLEAAGKSAREWLDLFACKYRCSWLVAPLPGGQSYGIWLAPKLPLDEAEERKVVFEPVKPEPAR